MGHIDFSETSFSSSSSSRLKRRMCKEGGKKKLCPRAFNPKKRSGRKRIRKREEERKKKCFYMYTRNPSQLPCSGGADGRWPPKAIGEAWSSPLCVSRLGRQSTPSCAGGSTRFQTFRFFLRQNRKEKKITETTLNCEIQWNCVLCTSVSDQWI